MVEKRFRYHYDNKKLLTSFFINHPLQFPIVAGPLSAVSAVGMREKKKRANRET